MKSYLFTALLAISITSTHATELPGFDFHYTVTGDSAVKPIQAFDDGKHLYLQFRDPDTIPALFINTTAGVVRLAVHQQFPYIVADTLTPEILVKFGEQQAIIKYAGGRALTDNGRMTGSSPPLAVASAATIPAERRVNPANSFADATERESFTGELIFNQNPTPTVKQIRPAVATFDSPSQLAAPVSTQKTVQKSAFHVVTAGESMASIAHRCKVSIYQLAALNNLANVNLIYPGQQLKVPVFTTDARDGPVTREIMMPGPNKTNKLFKKVTLGTAARQVVNHDAQPAASKGNRVMGAKIPLVSVAYQVISQSNRNNAR